MSRMRLVGGINNPATKIKSTKLLAYLLVGLMSLALGACLPVEEVVNDSELGGDTKGFAGIDAAETIASTKVTVKWTPTTDSSVTGYNIYDSTLSFEPRLLKSVDAKQSEATIAGLSEGFIYSFRVRAFDEDGKEDPNIKDLPAIPYGGAIDVEVISSSSVKIHYSDASQGEALETNIYCKDDPAGTWERKANVRNMTQTSVTIDGLEPNKTYYCKACIVVNGHEDNNSEILTFIPMGEAASLAFEVQPGSGAAGEALSQQPVIKILDENGNIVAGGPDAIALVTLQISDDSPTPGVVQGTATINAVGGIATFTDINLQEAGIKIIKAVKEDTSGQVFGTEAMEAASQTFSITAGTPSPDNSVIEIDPAAPPADPLEANGSNSYQVKITLADSFGNPIMGVKPKFESNIIGDILAQPTQSTDATGLTSGSITTTVADSLPPYRMLKITSPAGLTEVQIAAPFKPGAASKLAFTIQPVNSPAGELTMNSIKVAVQDTQGNIVTSSTATIAMAIASNTGGAVLSGTISQQAVNGIATFNDLGIDLTANGYRLVASSGALTPAYSNTFNVTAGIPKVVAMFGASSVYSGSCSGAITLQLQDMGGNPAKAIQNTPINISGLGGAAFYTSSTCGGSPIGTSVTFTAGTDTKVLYLKDQKAEALTIHAADTSNLMTPADHGFNVNPNKMTLLAQAAPPAAPGTPLTVTAGQCSTEIVVTPLGNDGSLGPVSEVTSVNVSGMLSTQAKIYSDASCLTQLDPMNVPLFMGSLPNVQTKIYLKDPKAENLLINVSDPNANIITLSIPQDVKVLASNIDFTGPTSVVAGQCSQVFTVTLKDTQGNVVTAFADTDLDINGVNGISATGMFYTSPSCSGAGTDSQLTIPSGNSVIQVYFKGVEAEVLNIFISDAANAMTDSQTIQLSISPSALEITGPMPAEALTGVCAGPFDIKTLDGVGAPANAIGNIDVSLSGEGIAGRFFADSGCENEVSGFTFSAGQGQKTFYFKGQFPASGLTLTATDDASVLTSGTYSWAVNADWGWFGTASTQTDESNNLIPFQVGVKPVAARFDGIQSGASMTLDPSNTYLTVADWSGHKLVRYNYATHQYVGWTGRIRVESGVGSTGSTVANPSPALCVSSTNGQQLPGWCTGGRPYAGNQTLGGLYYPRGVHDDGNYVYATSYHGHVVTRYNATTGAFAGWIGTVYTVSPTGAGPGGPATCSTTPANTNTPGWCIGGNNVAGNYEGDRLRYPWSITSDANYIYVGQLGAVLRYDKVTGSFQGWIGMVAETPTGGAVGCTSTSVDQLTPGWCTGGKFKYVNPSNHLGLAGGIYYASELLVIGSELYIVNYGYSGVINRYDLSSGAFIERLPNLSFNWVNPLGATTDGSNFFVADDERLLKVSLTGLVEGWLGKVANNAGMSGAAGCSTLQPNQNTPGWCLGGTHKPGLDENSFIDSEAVLYDGNGHLLVSGLSFPGIKKFDSTTGAYLGSFGLKSIAPTEWSNDRTVPAEYFGFDDGSMYTPSGVLAQGDYLFVLEENGSRIKKLNRYTGELLGWIGGMTSKPTGGVSTSCLTANAMSPAPTWCLGANFYPTFTWGDPNMIANVTNGIMYQPDGIATDGTWLYVTDRGLHRIQRFKVDDGSYGGWIGRIGVSPTGGAPGCNGAAVNTATPGWCTGGYSAAGGSDGEFYQPSGITYVAGNLYVVDAFYNRIVSINATTGGFNGWIGRIGTNPTAGCTFGSNGSYDVSTSGWCRGGAAAEASAITDRGGGFNFLWERGSISSDGAFLYVANSYNARVDKYNLNGEFQEATEVREDVYVSTWQSDPATVSALGQGCSYPMSIWVDGSYIYGLNAYPCNRDGDTMGLWKMNKTTGQIIGWKGGVSPAFPPSGGDPGCAGATLSTPGWCTGGSVGIGLKLGQFSGLLGSVHGDSEYLYVTDRDGNRAIRVPK